MIVDCDYRKWPDKPHWRFPATLIERDEFGTWLAALPPTPYTGPMTGEWDHAFIVLVPSDDWWMAAFNDDRHQLIDTYVDVCTPAEWLTSDHVRSIDLDLDVVRRRDGTVFLDDEDEFDEHQVLYGYPGDVVLKARDAAERLMHLVTERIEPFGDVGVERLRRVLADPYDKP